MTEQEKKTLKTNRWQKINERILWIDDLPLIWLVLPLLAVFFSYFFLLGKNCVMEINDQLDETLFTYVLNAKYLFSGVKTYPEMLNGVPSGGMTVSACIFIPLYRVFPLFTAFMLQYIIVVGTAYCGMYLCLKELTGSSMIGFLCGAMFMFLPYQPVYGLSVVGGPLIFYAFLCLYRQKHVIIDLLLIAYFALGANLVLLGYVALGFVLAADIWIFIRWMLKDRNLPAKASGRMGRKSGKDPCGLDDRRDEVKKRNRLFYSGSAELLLLYVLVNFSLFSELFLGNGGYVSHREEMVITGNYDFWGCVKDVFFNSAQHAPSLHQKLILPVLVVLVVYAFRWRIWNRRRLTADAKDAEDGREVTVLKTGSDEYAPEPEHAKNCCMMYRFLLLLFIVNILTALFYGFCQSETVVAFRNSVGGFLHYFSPYRVYWIYPTTWYLAAGLAAGLVWSDHDFLCALWRKEDGKKQAAGAVLSGLLICAALLPTAWHIRQNSIWLLNKSQYRNNRNVGLISWSDYFAEDLMRNIENTIFEKTGKHQQEYRVASLGMCPAVALEAGFYCIDGYSNNYSLEYKHAFRGIIAEELEKCPPMKAYFDDWGSRCYLFTEESQNYYYLAKDADFQYRNLQLNTDKMRALGCDYLFSAAEIEESNAAELELKKIGVFETEESYYRIWVYALK